MANPKLDTTCLINIQCYVATQGATDNALGIATLGWIIRADDDSNGNVVAKPNTPPNNIGTMITDPRREWWVREDNTDTLFGPLSFRDADKHARYLSLLEDKSGLAQVVTFLGSRGGDPVKDKNELFIAFLYIAGKRTLGGRMAEFNSEKDLLSP